MHSHVHPVYIIYMSGMVHLYAWHGSFVQVTWLTRVSDVIMKDMTHSYEWLICVAWFIQRCDMTYSDVWQDSFWCVTGLIHMCDMTLSYVWHDSFICVPWLIHMCDRTHSYVWHDSFIYVTWFINTCDMTHSYEWHDLFIWVTWLIHTSNISRPSCTCHSYEWHDPFIWASWPIHVNERDITHSDVWQDSFRCLHDIFTRRTWLIHTSNFSLPPCTYHSYVWRDPFAWVPWLIHMSDMTHSCKLQGHDSFIGGKWLI